MSNINAKSIKSEKIEVNELNVRSINGIILDDNCENILGQLCENEDCECPITTQTLSIVSTTNKNIPTEINLSSINSDIIPAENIKINIGTETNIIENIYANKLNVSSIELGQEIIETSNNKLIIPENSYIKDGSSNLTKILTLKGEKGDQGIQGIQGEKGADGTDGTNGTNGKDGTDGTNGKDGKDGRSNYNFTTSVFFTDLGNTFDIDTLYSLGDPINVSISGSPEYIGWPILPQSIGLYFNIFGKTINGTITPHRGATYGAMFPGDMLGLSCEIMAISVNYNSTDSDSSGCELYVANYGNGVTGNNYHEEYLITIPNSTCGSIDHTFQKGEGIKIYSLDYFGLYIKKGSKTETPKILIDATIYLLQE